MNRPYEQYNQCQEFTDMRELVLNRTRRFGDSIAFSYRESGIHSDRVSITFNEFRHHVVALGTELYNRGAADAHCALIGKLSYGWIVSYMALLSIGAVLVPLDPDWSSEELADVLKNSECSFLICDPSVDAPYLNEHSDVAEGNTFYVKEKEKTTISDLIASGEKRMADNDTSFFDAPIDPMKLSLLVYTSGTTGKGKGVMLNQKAILSNIANGLKIATIGKKLIGVLPPHHTFGSTIGILAPVCLGGEMYISGGLKYFLKELQEEKPDGMILVPLYLETFYRKIQSVLREKKKTALIKRAMTMSNGLRYVGVDLTQRLFAEVLKPFGGRLKTVICGGAPMSMEVFNFFSSLGITIMNGYGITECAPLVSVNRNKHIVPGTVGMPIPGDEIRIDTPNENGEGEICVKGPNVMLGYFHDPNATAAVIDSDGYFHTGDIGKIVEHGYICITGRMKNLIILSNGKNVYPEEIESELSAIPGVEDVVVYEGISRQGVSHNKIVVEFFMEEEYVKHNMVGDVQEYLAEYVKKYNKTALHYKKIDIVKVRDVPFPKNTLRKIVRFKIDRTIQ